MTTFTRTDSDNTDFAKLVLLLDEDLKIRDGDDHAYYAQFNKTNMLRNAVVCYADDVAVGCGAFKKYEDQTAEIKRMYVLPAFRGQGIASAILKELERWAAEVNYVHCILETGKNQPEAIAMYRKAGYQLIENYGQYKGVDNSICMTKPVA
jgi:GNAT superfamily N-acetyltransferase